MGCIYSCSEMNSYSFNTGFVVADERAEISSNAYVHSFFLEDLNVTFLIISDYIGVDMPYLEMKDSVIVGSSHNLYIIDTTINNIKCSFQLPLPSPCDDLILDHEQYIAICACDVLIMSPDNQLIGHYAFDDTITDYFLNEGRLTVYLMEGDIRVLCL